MVDCTASWKFFMNKIGNEANDNENYVKKGWTTHGRITCRPSISVSSITEGNVVFTVIVFI